MLNEKELLANQERFIDLLNAVNREGINSLISYLKDKTDFFYAPASTRYHGNYKGGLCQHCLAVYDNLVKLSATFEKNFSNDTLILVALLHDLAKVNFYETYMRNVKEDGQWVQKEEYRIRDISDRFIYGSHEQTSLFIAQQFIPLSIEEQVAINSHHGGLGDMNLHVNIISDIYNTYNLPVMLHCADLIDAFNHE